MISKSQIKLITSLHQKKYRIKHDLFFVEGTKVIQEFYGAGWEIYALFSTEEIDFVPDGKVTLISEIELKKISALKTPNKALAVFFLPTKKPIENFNFSIALDGIRDPGNMGTIIRLCDWFGVKSLLCSKDTVDCFNPKVLQASMGSLARVEVHYLDLENYFEKNQLPVFGAFMEGNNVYREKLPRKAILLMGNEGKGISAKLETYLSKKISIPQFGVEQQTESLNVAMATSILLSEFHRSTEM
ncbi:MAG: RNA methyltransferase [Flavobacteriaceae bacterium]|nr:RNA methyltransferase [Flavobacteriaceae bacterium]